MRRFVGQLPFLLGDAVAQLLANWRQHTATLAGIVWGSASLILLLSLGAAFNKFLELGVEAGGSRWMMVVGEYSTSKTGGARPGRFIRFEAEDFERLQAGAASATAVAAEIVELASTETPRLTRATVISGGTLDLDRIQNHVIGRGRWFGEYDYERARRVAVLGHDVVQPFFGDEDPLGQTIQIEGVPFEVVGVLADKGFQLITNLDEHDDMIFVPLGAAQRALERGDEIDHLLLNPGRLEDADALRAEVRAVLLPLHNLDESEERPFIFHSVTDTMRPVRMVGIALQVLLGLVGTVTLAMSGIGVANLMVALANARKREFAMRRACGARRSDLVTGLVAETLAVVLAGGVVGAALGLALVGILNLVPLPPSFPAPRLVPSVVVTTFFVLAATGLAAGILPARLASKVDPSVALRSL